MRFLVIDSETTGLDPNTCQMVELGMVHADVSINREGVVSTELKTLELFFKPLNSFKGFVGEDYAMNMNKDIMASILDGGVPSVTYDRAIHPITQFISDQGYGKFGWVPCGKNVMGFDMSFCRKIPGWRFPIIKHKHRSIDVGTLMLRPADECPPDLQECKSRAGIVGAVSHRAIDDCMDCVKIVEYWMRRNHERGVV